MAPSKESKAAKRNLLDDWDSDSDHGGAAAESDFKVNEEFARRFEHNKKREERQRLEEKFKNDQEDDEDSSDDETEDENGFLATEDLDVQISATLQAIKNKDPRVYDKDQTFYKPEDETTDAKKDKKEKPVFLRDYHREKILRGDIGADDDDEPPQTYEQEQEAAKKEFLSGVKGAEAHSDSDDDDGFMMKKKSDDAAAKSSNGVHPSRSGKIKISGPNIDDADKDPETFLSNFMAARAWVSEEGGRWKAFESDDGEEDDGADEFEQAYNMRFEDPEKSKEVLRSYARDVTSSRSVRREEVTGRKRLRELQKEHKVEEKKGRSEEKARLRKLKLEEAEKKLRKIKQAAGAVGKELSDAEWMSFLDDAWDNDNWEVEMRKRFGDDYYAVKDDDMVAGGADSNAEDAAAGPSSKKTKPKKPKWDDDIEINDIVPEFESEEAKAKFALSDAEEEQEEDEEEAAPAKKKRKTADIKKERIDAQKKSKKERAKLEALVDAKMELTDHDLLRDSARVAAASASASFPTTTVQPFRYRETSPQSFGMTARDILLAPSDKVLNEFAGLKKFASFRDDEKKRRDRKHLGKKARLRQWRRDVFGRDYERTGPTFGFERFADEEEEEEEGSGPPPQQQQQQRKGKHGSAGTGNVVEGAREEGVQAGKKKRKRSKSKKVAETEA
ncbi:hypothetical protein MY11210_006162 [Beauveria gryllotalpidicola]